MRFRVIEEHRGCWPVSVMCRVFRVSQAGYYAWSSRPDSKRAAENRALLDDIRAVHAASQGRYGSPRVPAALRTQGRDLHTRKPDAERQSEIVGWSMRDHLRAELATSALLMAIQRQRPQPGLIQH